MKYTDTDQDLIEKRIDRDIASIQAEVIKEGKRWGLVSLLLYGGFARGEGSVEVKGDKVRPLNDYDFLAVSSFPCPPYLSFRRFSQELSARSDDYNIDIMLRPLWFMKRAPSSIFYYELKKGGRVLWGRDVLSLMPEIEPGAIPLSDGLATFFNRLMSLLEAYASEDRKLVIYQCNKAILTCLEMLLILARRYHWSYKERLSIFKSIFKKSFSSLAAVCPEFLPLADRATNFKLRPDYGLYPEEDIWDKTAALYLKVLDFYLEEFMCRQPRRGERWTDFLKTFPLKTIPSWLVFRLRKMAEKDFSGGCGLVYQPYIWSYLAGYEWLRAWVLKDNSYRVRRYLRYLSQVDYTDDFLTLKEKIIANWKKASLVL